VILLVEVSDTSADYDTGGKADLYAQAGILDYWVVLLNTREVLVHRSPGPEGYGSVARLDEDASIAALAASDIVLSVRGLLAR
jgi:Uma2 family endonuclease